MWYCCCCAATAVVAGGVVVGVVIIIGDDGAYDDNDSFHTDIVNMTTHAIDADGGCVLAEHKSSMLICLYYSDHKTRELLQLLW